MAETLPLFPLGTVLLPGASLPLHIFEPRYRQLTVDLVTGAVPDKTFGIVAARPGHAMTPGDPEPVHEFGCSALLREARRLPDGRFDIITRGERRFRLLDIESDAAPYFVASIEWVSDSEPAAEQLRMVPMLMKSARDAHRLYCSAAWQSGEWSEPGIDASAAELPYLLAADCLLPLEDRQALLEEQCPADRLRLVRKMLVREAEFLRTLRAVPAPLHQYSVETTSN